MKSRNLLSVADLTGGEIHSLISNAIEMKAGGKVTLSGKEVLALLFEKPSLRTRVSFEIAMLQLGGHTMYLSPAEVGLGKRESVPDVARVLGRYVSAIAARTISHQTLEILAQYSAVPVINALSDLEHPCQALADLLTIYEKKIRLEGLELAYVGDGNNVANSLLLAASLTGMNTRLASPRGYWIPDKMMKLAQSLAKASGSKILYTEEPQQAVKGADIVYTDVWASMGQETEADQRRQVFAGYQVNRKLLSLAKKDAILMHPLPAHRGEEVEADILDSPQSVVFDQAENRMHLQKALIAEILGNKLPPGAN